MAHNLTEMYERISPVARTRVSITAARQRQGKMMRMIHHRLKTFTTSSCTTVALGRLLSVSIFSIIDTVLTIDCSNYSTILC